MDLIPISMQDYLNKLNEALGEEYLARGYRFFASPNRLEPGRVDWLRNPETDHIFIAALGRVESTYRPILVDIKIDNR
jgi:hypothetical protein